MARNRIIIDTDPGIDDILALLLAFSASPDELEVLLISLTYGNIEVEKCLRNVVSLFYHIEKEREWRKSKGLAPGFEGLEAKKPIVAIGATKPLADQIIMADYYHGIDGLGGIHHTHPHLSPEATWRHLFDSSTEPIDADIRDQDPPRLFVPSPRPAHEEMLQVLRDHPPGTVTIVTIGPLTNAARAAAVDPATFLRAKQVLTMGGAVDLEGNVTASLSSQARAQLLAMMTSAASTPEDPPSLPAKFPNPPCPCRVALNLRNQITPVAEFNIFADAIAAARVLALSSPKPSSTMPAALPPSTREAAGEAPEPYLTDYPSNLGRQLDLKLFPLDITTTHNLTRQYWDQMMQPPAEEGSPLVQWMSAFLGATFRKTEELYHIPADQVGLNLHDPLPIWYLLSEADGGWTLTPPTDVRIETTGQWTRGMCVVDRRARKRRDEVDDRGEVVGDMGDWLSWSSGNRVRIVKDSPGKDLAQRVLLERILRRM